MRDTYKKTNVYIALIVVGLALFGLLMQYSASSYNALRDYGDSFYYVKKQALALVAGLAFMVIATKIKTASYHRFSIPILLIGFALLAILFIPGVGVEKYGATRWINLGVTTFQPSEFAKFALMIFIARSLSKRSTATVRGMLPILLVTGATAALIIIEPNMSITMLVVLSALVMVFLGGAKFKHFLMMVAPIAIGVVILILIEPYRVSRILAFIDPWSSPKDEGFQLIQSYYALSSGGLFGVGLFNSRQKYAFLPFAESDFILAIIGEELGIFGCIILMIVFFLFAWFGARTAIRATNPFNSYLAAGITTVISLQACLNMAVVTGTIPPTGLPLPFISAGGSSLLIFMLVSGILMRINIESAKEREKLFDASGIISLKENIARNSSKLRLKRDKA